jgi:hypothetical protein
LLFLTLLTIAFPATAATAEEPIIQAYKALYSVSRNGKTVGKVELTLELGETRWTVNSQMSGTHGLARVLRVRDTERVDGKIESQQFLPLEYERNSRIAGVNNRWLTEFNWDGKFVTVQHDKDDPMRLAMSSLALDPLTMKLEMRRRLVDEEPDLHFMMVEEDEIDEQNFRLLDDEWLETSLGCLQARPVEKIRHNSSRYTRAWHALELANIEVRMEHGKTGGDHVEMRITELTLDGQVITPRAGCSARRAEAIADT